MGHTQKKKKKKKKAIDSLKSIDKHAVLVVDGHTSRYDPEMFRILREADIDLLIILSHSSHVLQPLVLTLNRLFLYKFF